MERDLCTHTDPTLSHEADVLAGGSVSTSTDAGSGSLKRVRQILEEQRSCHAGVSTLGKSRASKPTKPGGKRQRVQTVQPIHHAPHGSSRVQEYLGRGRISAPQEHNFGVPSSFSHNTKTLGHHIDNEVGKSGGGVASAPPVYNV